MQFGDMRLYAETHCAENEHNNGPALLYTHTDSEDWLVEWPFKKGIYRLRNSQRNTWGRRPGLWSREGSWVVGLERRFKCEEPQYLPAAGARAIVLATQNPGPFPKEICVCMLVRGRVLSLVEAEGWIYLTQVTCHLGSSRGPGFIPVSWYTLTSGALSLMGMVSVDNIPGVQCHI